MTEITKEEMRERLGNIGQIRDLLFGSQIREYEDQFQKIESELARLFAFKEEIIEQVEQLQQTLSQEIVAVSDSLEKRLKYLSLTTHEEINKLSQEQGSFAKSTSNNLDNLTSNFNKNIKNLKAEITSNQEQLEGKIDNVKALVNEELENHFGKLQEVKVSRDDLAEVLFELCLKVKGSGFVPDLKEASDTKADFLLPEQEQKKSPEN